MSARSVEQLKKIHRVEVEVIGFDQWWSEHGNGYPAERARLFNIDTQGHELSVFKGAKLFLRNVVKYKYLFLELEKDATPNRSSKLSEAAMRTPHRIYMSAFVDGR